MVACPASCENGCLRAIRSWSGRAMNASPPLLYAKDDVESSFAIAVISDFQKRRQREERCALVVRDA